MKLRHLGPDLTLPKNTLTGGEGAVDMETSMQAESSHEDTWGHIISKRQVSLQSFLQGQPQGVLINQWTSC